MADGKFWLFELYFIFTLDYYGGYEGQEVPQQEGDGMNALNLKWVLGFNKDID